MSRDPVDPKIANLLRLIASPPVPKPDNPFGGLLGLGLNPPPAKPPLPVAPFGSGLSGFGSLAGMFLDPPTSAPALSPYASQGLGALSGLFDTTPPSTNPFGSLARFVMPAPAPATPPRNSLYDLVTPPPPPYSTPYFPPAKPKPIAPETKRKAFFSFNFEDVMRANNVRQAWKITHPSSVDNRSFYDSSLWESRKLTNDEALKKLIRAGVLYTSAVCVLAGSATYSRRWVRYEIARAIIDGRGLLTVHLNGLKHHQTRTPHPNGPSPLAFMAIGRHQPDIRKPALYYLYEKEYVSDGRGGWVPQWIRYADHRDPITLPKWVNDPGHHDYVMPLSVNAAEYDYVVENGHRNIGSWIDKAAKQAGR